MKDRKVRREGKKGEKVRKEKGERRKEERDGERREKAATPEITDTYKNKY